MLLPAPSSWAWPGPQHGKNWKGVGSRAGCGWQGRQGLSLCLFPLADPEHQLPSLSGHPQSFHGHYLSTCLMVPTPGSPEAKAPSTGGRICPRGAWTPSVSGPQAGGWQGGVGTCPFLGVLAPDSLLMSCFPRKLLSRACARAPTSRTIH